MDETPGFRMLVTVGGGGDGRIGYQMVGWYRQGSDFCLEQWNDGC